MEALGLAQGFVLAFVQVVLMAVAATFTARILDRYRWVAWIGFAIVLYVAADMIRGGRREVVAATRKA